MSTTARKGGRREVDDDVDEEIREDNYDDKEGDKGGGIRSTEVRAAAATRSIVDEQE